MVEISERDLETFAAMISHIIEGEKSRHSRDFCEARREEGDCKVCAREGRERMQAQPLRSRTSLYSHFLPAALAEAGLELTFRVSNHMRNEPFNGL